MSLLAQKLKYARERSNLTGQRVKERTGIGESSVSEFERGKREPSLSQLQKLGCVYNRSVSFFLSDEAIQPEVVLWREHPARGMQEVESRFLRLCERYHNLEMWTDDVLPVCLPTVEISAEAFRYADAEALAKRFRETFQLGDRPAQVLLSVLEEVCGVKVFHISFEPSGTAASTMSGTFGPAILLNSRNARWRRNHDLAHELFHLLTWRVFRSCGENTTMFMKPNEQEEKFATCFARNLLMPAEAVRVAVNSRLRDGMISYESLLDIARQFDVSVESLLWHLHFLYNRGPAEKEKTEKEIEHARTLSTFREEREQHEPPVWPERYSALAIKALRHGEISIGRFAEYLHITREMAMKFIEQEAEDHEEVQIAPA